MGNRALITGGAAGIGCAIAERLAGDGYAVALVDKDAASLTATAAALRERVRDVVVHAEVFDVRDIAGARGLCERVQAALGGLDTLVNNAGVRHISPIEDVTPESWREEIDVKLTGSLFLLQAAIPHLRAAGKAKVVNVASVSALMGYNNRAGYCTANAGLLGLTREAAVELAPAGIFVNAVAPGFIATAMTPYPDEVVATMERAVPLGRRGTPEDVASAVAFLCGDDSDYVTGATLTVSGGVVDGFMIDAAPWANRYANS